MQVLIYIFFISIFVLDYLSNIGVIARYLTWLSELLAACVLALIVPFLAQRKRIDLPGRYWAVLAAFLLIVVCGVVLNSVASGTLFAGLRNYAKFIPFFLLPAVILITNNALKKQLVLLLILSFAQLPVAVYQRLERWPYILTGDGVRGTLTDSGVLSIYLLGAISVATGFYVKKRLALWQFLTILVVLFIPTTINETKITFFLMPLALLIPFFAQTKDARRLTRLFGMCTLVFMMFAAFVTVYDHFVMPRWGHGILEFLTKEDRMQGYLAPNVTRDSADRVGKIDGVILPFKKLDDPTQLLLGLGLGNVSPSFLGERYSGEYLTEYGDFVKGAFSNLVWEVGVLGALTLCVLGFMVFLDALSLKDNDDMLGVFALGWIGALGILAASVIYNRAIYTNEVGYLSWYFCGLIAAGACRQRQNKALTEEVSMQISNAAHGAASTAVRTAIARE